jgi:hypothetical protein
MILNKNIFFKVTVISLIIISFFLGYFLRENSTGGGPEFYELSWPIIQSFKKDFLFTIKNYGSFRDYTIPFSHILNAYINPFSNDIESFQLSITVISFAIFLVFAQVFKKIFRQIKIIDILLISSTILLLPFFRTSAFWGKNENYGWLFFILALYFFSEIKKDLFKNYNNRNTLNIILFCFTSACALYARQALVFLPISYFLYLFFNNANKKIIITSIISFTIFAIPAFLFIFIWGNVFDLENNPGFFTWWIHPRHLLKNFPILLSFFGFYFLPLLTIEFFNLDFKNFIKKYFNSFLFALIIFVFLSQINLLNYLGDYTRGGGAILKVNYLIQKNNFFLLLIFSSIGFSVLMRLFKEDVKNNFTFLLPMLIIYCFPNLLYQEYVEPLIIIIFFLILKTNLQKMYFKNITFSNLIFLSYFTIYLIGSIYFKHFAFDSYEKWKIFLDVQ